MTITFESAAAKKSTQRVMPSKVSSSSKPFTLAQELKRFGRWTESPIWVPPKDSSSEMAESMLRLSGLRTPKQERWQAVVESHRDSFTQVREIELEKASIRLPKGKLFVSVTEQKHFDRITDAVPACVQTRLEEFLEGPGKQRGVKVSYLKPLCVEVGDQLHFTSRAGVLAAIEKIQNEVFTEYDRRYLGYQVNRVFRGLVDSSLALPRTFINFAVQRRQRAIDAYQAKLEFKRRKIALRAARTHKKCRTDGCTFDQMLALTNPLQREDVIRQYSAENELSRAKQKRLLLLAAGQLPWFAALSMGLSYISTITLAIAPPVAVCDPAFVAEFPDAPGVLMNIGHFDEIAGVRHVEF